jgi:hypothetical protein
MLTSNFEFLCCIIQKPRIKSGATGENTTSHFPPILTWVTISGLNPEIATETRFSAQ